MPKGLPKVVSSHLEKAKESTVAAVDCYNRCGTKFRSGSYIVLMCIAWTSLLHAVFFKRKVNPFYRESEGSKRFKKIDGDYKAWELATCIDKYYPGQTNPVTENLRFLLSLRNKIEHRSMPALDNDIFGESQACLFNFEEVLFNEFGTKHCLSECLSLAIQFSRLRNDQQGKSISELHKPLRARCREGRAPSCPRGSQSVRATRWLWLRVQHPGSLLPGSALAGSVFGSSCLYSPDCDSRRRSDVFVIRPHYVWRNRLADSVTPPDLIFAPGLAERLDFQRRLMSRLGTGTTEAVEFAHLLVASTLPPNSATMNLVESNKQRFIPCPRAM